MNFKNLQNKKCLITGAASGIGKATAILAAQHGAELFLTDINKTALLEVTEQIRANNGSVSFFRDLDISDYEQVKLMADDIHKTFGSLDILMNIAGIAIWGSVENMQHAEWRKVIDINLMGPIHVMETFLPEMIKAEKGGHLVNVASAAGLFGLPWHGAYCASKYGLRGVSDVLRYDLHKHKISVSLVCPGAVETGLVQSVQIAGISHRSEEEVKKIKARFQQYAITPEKAAVAILEGIRKKQYMVFTSPDIKFGYFSQRKFTAIYEWTMQQMNNYFQKIMLGK
jgi:NAD(P)-dependent dehydrogenase (short-subunit alcohol dehydrogenase family)